MSVRKISPTEPSSYMPAVMYPSCPPSENLWVIDWRSRGILLRAGLSDRVTWATAPATASSTAAEIRASTSASVKSSSPAAASAIDFASCASVRSACAVFEPSRSEEHTSELQSHSDLVCRLLLEKKKKGKKTTACKNQKQKH